MSSYHAACDWLRFRFIYFQKVIKRALLIHGKIFSRKKLYLQVEMQIASWLFRRIIRALGSTFCYRLEVFTLIPTENIIGTHTHWETHQPASNRMKKIKPAEPTFKFHWWDIILIIVCATEPRCGFLNFKIKKFVLVSFEMGTEDPWDRIAEFSIEFKGTALIDTCWPGRAGCNYREEFPKRDRCASLSSFFGSDFVRLES